ncbi:hypothetical protein M413DRAFT_442043 [Hebeloma cylindrosporum]|uniref:SET domain-containing protein n=1 Tax=Hebeloma cylindrosporum TaxID=76867 RepID=A0A0C3CMM4_HEBCY|nr:hypothetical protein M413DRAFT_442043 [Hebeloma cylindrosporum h7]
MDESSPPPTSELDGSEPEIIDVDEIDRQQQRDYAYDVYLEVSKSFYTWEREDASQALAGLARNHTKRKSSRRPFPTHDLQYQEGEKRIPFTVEKWTSHSHEKQSITSEPILVVAQGWDPYPQYTACTPTSTSLSGPPNPHLRASFAPYADDVRFKLEPFLADFEDFAWQNDFPDPDSELIQLEVVRRLVFHEKKFSYNDIDELQIFPFPVRENNRAGLVSYALQRDFCWLAPHDSDEQLQRSYVDDSLDLYGELTKDLPLFCPSLSCLKSFCSIHGFSNPVFPSKPKVTTAAMMDQTSRKKHPPCKRDCYQSMEFGHLNMVNSHWSREEVTLFASVIKLTPDTFPCDLAVICRKPCFEVYIQRRNTFSDEDIASYNRDMEEQKQASAESEAKVIELYEDELIDQGRDIAITMVTACYHLGACNQFADKCLCFQKRQRCQRGCRCAKTCELRFKGCRCSHKKTPRGVRVCGPSTNCPCRLRNRECDPELCKGCNARSDSSGDKKNCKNVDIQKGRFQQIWIKKSAYGLGAFAVDNIAKDKFIGEYVGETYIDASLPTFLSPMQKHVGLNYLFTYTENPEEGDNISLDSWNIGNETRYLNDDYERSNCLAKTYFVNGSYRIALFTLKQVRSGDALTLSYGDKYWLKEDAEENEHS